MTARDGKLVAIQPSGGRVLAEFEVPRNNKGWKVTCHSGIAIGKDYLVYAVVDEPPEGDFASRKERCVGNVVLLFAVTVFFRSHRNA